MDNRSSTDPHELDADAGSQAFGRRETSGTLEKATQMADRAFETIKASGTSIAGTATETAKEFAGKKVASGGDWMAHVASSVHCAADDLQPNAPELARLVRQAGERIDSLSHDLQSQSVDELVRTAANFARRRPEVVFGVSAVLGFLAFRVARGAAPRPETGGSIGA